MRKTLIIFFSALTGAAGVFMGGPQILKIAQQGRSLHVLADVASVMPGENAVPASSVVTPIVATDTSPSPTSASNSTSPKTKTKKTKVAAVPAPVPLDFLMASPPDTPPPITNPPPLAIPAPAPTTELSTDTTTTTNATTSTATPSGRTLPYSIGTFGDRFAPGDGWGTWWGTVSQANGTLTIAAASGAAGSSTASTSGAGALLTDSGAWTNYTFTATVDWLKGQSFGLVARYADENNYVICQFAQRAAGDVYVSLQQYDNGIATERAKGDVVNYDQLGGADITAAVQVWGNQAACAFNDHMISTVLANNPLVNPPAHGQVGFSVWDPTKGTSEIIVKTAAVTTDIYNLGPNIEE